MLIATAASPNASKRPQMVPRQGISRPSYGPATPFIHLSRDLPPLFFFSIFSYELPRFLIRDVQLKKRTWLNADLIKRDLVLVSSDIVEGGGLRVKFLKSRYLASIQNSVSTREIIFSYIDGCFGSR